MKCLFLILTGIASSAYAAGSGLIIGYEGEGRVDASYGACKSFVEGLNGSDVQEGDSQVLEVCTARQNHLRAYDEFQTAYRIFRQALTGTKIGPDDPSQAMVKLLRNCIVFRSNMLSGARGVGLDIIGNEAPTDCLKLGTQMLNEQSLPYLSWDIK